MAALLIIIAYFVIGSVVIKWIDRAYAKKFPNSPPSPAAKSYKVDNVFDLMFPRYED